MFLAADYTTDNGSIFAYLVPLYIGYNNEYANQNIATSPLIPAILIPQLKWFARPCPTKQIISRHALITLQSGSTFGIAYPFKPNTPEWYTFWQQLQSPEIVSIKRIGETVTDKLLRSSLNP